MLLRLQVNAKYKNETTEPAASNQPREQLRSKSLGFSDLGFKVRSRGDVSVLDEYVEEVDILKTGREAPGSLTSTQINSAK